ncbi:helix-turn-helix domain-containing protein [Sphingobium vermicomposti]|uniref:DNA-binding IclR family transcriptional regulator n=1 Tax=Sphingobium vermicomposti TaxID=529005 RepID=A0A846M7V5_9SPHN|nr:helix-turn-helix domain-containing protein [Sphingobium vermicomposti]NIJ17929.1 DNA-binding IclR family transcriptional regulator [Sphingobium vermicomposti]
MSSNSQAEGRSGGRGSVKSCLRTLEVLEYFMRTGIPARTIEISEALGIPNSSADEILRTLASTGYLSYNQSTKLYAPSYKIVANAFAIEHSFFGSGSINEVMEEMRRETGGSVFVTQQNDCWSESVAEMSGGWAAKPDVEPYYSAEMICFQRNSWRPSTNFTAAMLAQQSNVDIIQLATRTQRLGLGPNGPTLMKHLVDRISQTRARGFALCRRNATIPVDSIAMPLRVPHSVASYAIGVVGDPLFVNDNDVRRMLSSMQSVVFRYNDRIRRNERISVQ